MSPLGELVLAETLTFPTFAFNPYGLERAEEKNKCSFPKLDDAEGLELSLGESGEGEAEGASAESIGKGRRRSRRRFFDLIQCNHDLDVMVTFTVSAERADRCDYNDIMSKLNYWLSNRVQRNGLKYILVPEYHADGVAIHFHGFMNREALKLKDSGRKRKGRRVYNVVDYPLGWSTAVKLDEGRAYASWYCYKYITKADERIGGRYMLSGGKLNKPVYRYNLVDYDEAAGNVVTVAEGVVCKINAELTF